MFKSLFFPVFLASLLFSCGSGSSRPRGKQCGIDYIPIKVEKQASEDLEEISLDPQAQQLPQGTYDFENLDFYLVDAPTKMEFHIKGAKNKSGEFTTSTECVRGVHPEIPLPESTSIGLEKMSVDDKKGVSSFSSLAIHLEFDGVMLHTRIGKIPNPLGKASPIELYSDKFGSFAFYKSKQGNQFELRSKQIGQDQSHFLIIRYKFTPTGP